MKPVLLPLPYSARFYDTLAHIITERRYFAPRPSKVHACVCVCVCISQCICNTHTHTLARTCFILDLVTPLNTSSWVTNAPCMLSRYLCMVHGGARVQNVTVFEPNTHVDRCFVLPAAAAEILYRTTNDTIDYLTITNANPKIPEVRPCVCLGVCVCVWGGGRCFADSACQTNKTSLPLPSPPSPPCVCLAAGLQLPAQRLVPSPLAHSAARTVQDPVGPLCVYRRCHLAPVGQPGLVSAA